MDSNFATQLFFSILFFAPGIILFAGLAFVGVLMLLEKTVFKGQSNLAVTNVATMINEIAAASKEQSDGIVQVNQAVSQMDEMTQQNAALVEQSTAAAKSLEEMARELDGLVSKFEVREGAAQLAPPRPSSAPQRQAPRPIAKRPPAGRAPLAPPRQAPAARPPQVKAAPAQDDEWEEF